MCKNEWKVDDNELFSSLGIRIGDISKLTPKDEEELSNLEGSLDKGTIPEKLKEKFNTINILVSENAVKKSEGEWVTTDEKKEHAYGIKKEDKELKIYGEPSFEQLIKKISNYAYDKRGLDARFEIKAWLENLLERELFLSITKKRHRDHLLHACRMALLGERILLGNITYDDGKEFRLLDLVRELFRKQKDTQKLLKLYEVDTLKNEALDEKILQVWFIAALFHDVGFIYEAFTEVWENLKDIMKYPNFREMHLDIEKALANFKKRFSVSDVREYNSKFTREFDHSKIGACLISNLLGESDLICDMAAFITDHHSSNETLEFTERPLSFLMVLLDEIQEWQRPVLGRKLRDQILSEKISKLSPFIEYPEVKPELESISLSSDNDKDFEIKMKNGNLNLDFTLDYGDNVAVLEKTDFSFPLMLYLKYKDLQRLKIGDERKLKEALREALEVSPLFSRDSTDDIITELNNKSVSKELERLFNDNLLEQALEKPKVQVIQKDKEWEVVDRDKKYLIQNDNGELIVYPDLPFNFSISFDFTSKGALANKWHRQCDILLYETLEHKNKILSNWLDNIINYRTKDIIKFEIGNMPRVLSGDFKGVVARSNETYLQEENVSYEKVDVKYTYERFERDRIKFLAEFDITLKNNNPERIKQIFLALDTEIMDATIKKASENGSDIYIADIWRSPIPKKDYEKGEHKERFVMSIPFAKPLLNDEDKDIDYEIEIALPASILERENLIDGFYNWRPYDTKSGKVTVHWDKELFDDKYSIGLFLCNCTYAELEVIQSGENMNKIINVWNNRSKLNKEVDRIKKELKEKYEECKCEIYPEHPSKDTEGNYYFKRNFENLEMRHLAVFLWIPKSAI
jgi:hypothetical protein